MGGGTSLELSEQMWAGRNHGGEKEISEKKDGGILTGIAWPVGRMCT